MKDFEPESYWTIKVEALAEHSELLKLEWLRGSIYELDVANAFLNRIQRAQHAEVTELSVKEQQKERPKALNTVELLKQASTRLGIGPGDAMRMAEQLYTRGFISYPRTETTEYPEEFDYMHCLRHVNPTSIQKWSDDSLRVEASFLR